MSNAPRGLKRVLSTGRPGAGVAALWAADENYLETGGHTTRSTRDELGRSTWGLKLVEGNRPADLDGCERMIIDEADAVLVFADTDAGSGANALTYATHCVWEKRFIFPQEGPVFEHPGAHPRAKPALRVRMCALDSGDWESVVRQISEFIDRHRVCTLAVCGTAPPQTDRGSESQIRTLLCQSFADYLGPGE